MSKFAINLWFDNQAEEAAKFYTSVFKDSEIKSTLLRNESWETPDNPSNQPVGSVGLVNFRLNDLDFVALNGGPIFKFNEAVSIIINCDNQEEVDYYWEKLSADLDAEACGWLKDKYGVSWQVVPSQLEEMMSDPDEKKASRVNAAVLKMKKLDLAQLQKAFAGD